MRKLSVTYGLLIALLALLAVGFSPLSAEAQLISPGKLIESHSNLEGLTNCTQCHSLGNRSASNTLCLDCHTPIATRIEADLGYHATVSDQNCATCHKDHFGVEFDAIRFDSLTFEHEITGFELTGSHVEASCRSCHQPEYIIAEDVIAFKGEHDALDKTFLGVADQCISCHNPESPHENQFEDTNCGTCHETEIWEEAPLFDHDTARFALTGKHVDVACEDCHTTQTSLLGTEYVQYVDIPFASCNSCHEDQHEGAFGTDCASCHRTEGWANIAQSIESDFDHTSTGFELVGSHAQLECASCHGKPARADEVIQVAFTAATRGNSYPIIPVENCASCHVDYHDGVFDDPTNNSCETCHGETAWYPSSFDLTRHDDEAAFELTGAHRATPCASCHQPDLTQKPHFDIPNTACKDCHEEDDPHGDQFIADGVETTCETCHVTEDWLISSVFDHDETAFPLTGRHVETECAACHTSPTTELAALSDQQFRGTSTECASCHAEEDPHQGQFEEQLCDDCHNTASFLIAVFDHEQTEFPLTGEHQDVSCRSCHIDEIGADQQPFIRFKPLGTACQDCHSEE